MATLGNNTGTSTDSPPTDYVVTSGSAVGTAWTMPSDGTLTKMTLKLAGASGSTWLVRAVIYNDSSGAPGTYFSVSNEITVANGAAAAEVDFTGFDNTALTNGQNMWLGLWSGAHSQPGFVYCGTGSSGIQKYQSGLTYSSTGPAPTFSAVQNFTNNYWAYITYTTSSVHNVGTKLPVALMAPR